MKQEKLTFRMAARCEAAGRPNNEDNYQVDADLSDNEWGFTADANVELGNKGALLIVCDGMGGMNAGEVASAIAVATLKKQFAAERLTTDALADPSQYVKQAIIAADAAIKEHEKSHPETEGMGSTVVMAWILEKKVYVGWCGDSRCYRYNSKLGLTRLSHDHSYVQELVDAGTLTEELAFDHPNSNIITRSLGDPRGAAQPDVREFDLYNEDILLLCSDGLCGCLRDKEIEEQLKAHQTSMQECRDALWEAAKAAGWTDNVTIALAQVLSGAGTAPEAKSTSETNSISNSKAEKLRKANKRLKMIIAALVVVLLLVVVALIYPQIPKASKDAPPDVAADTIQGNNTKEQEPTNAADAEQDVTEKTQNKPDTTEHATIDVRAAGNQKGGKNQEEPKPTAPLPKVETKQTDTTTPAKTVEKVRTEEKINPATVQIVPEEDTGKTESERQTKDSVPTN